jgi:hypothetical protein
VHAGRRRQRGKRDILNSCRVPGKSKIVAVYENSRVLWGISARGSRHIDTRGPLRISGRSLAHFIFVDVSSDLRAAAVHELDRRLTIRSATVNARFHTVSVRSLDTIHGDRVSVSSTCKLINRSRYTMFQTEQPSRGLL